MRRRDVSGADLPKETVLQIDKDGHVEGSWMRNYMRVVVTVCRLFRVKVVRVRKTTTRKGFHLYVEVDPPLDAERANRLQWLLGDDSRRVDWNRARIRSGLMGWNILFEKIGAKLRTVYARPKPPQHRY